MHSHSKHPFGADPSEDYSEFGDDVHLNPKLLLKSMRDLFTIWKEGGRIITKDFDIRYAAGISDQAMDYYRDRSLPDTIVIDGIEIEYDLAWWLHETTEADVAKIAGERKNIILGDLYRQTRNRKYICGEVARVHYRASHQVALLTEYGVIDALGVDRKKYTNVCDQMIKDTQAKTMKDSPGNLYLYPYEDEGDMSALHEIADTGGPWSYMLFDRGQRGGMNGEPFYE